MNDTVYLFSQPDTKDLFSMKDRIAPPRTAIHFAWIVLAVLFFDLFVNYSVRLGYGVILPEMIRSLNLNRTQGGTIFNFYLLTYICMTPLTGNLTDRFGARRVITFFCLFLVVGAILMGTSGGFGQASLYFAITGIGAAAMWTPVITLIQRWFSPRKRGMALGILSTGYGLGLAVMGLLFPLVVASFSWRHCWYFLGALALIMVAINGLFLRSSPEAMNFRPWGESSDENVAPSAQNTPSNPKVHYMGIFREKRFYLIGCSYLFAAMALYILGTFMVDYANVELGLSYRDAAFLATIYGLSQVAGVLTIPILSDRIGRRLTLMGTNSFIALGVLGILFSGGNLCFLYPSVVVLGMHNGATWPMYGACGGDYFPKEVMGTVIGAWTPFYGIGAISANFIGGRIRDVTQSFEWAFYLAVISAVIAAGLMSAVKKDVSSSG